MKKTIAEQVMERLENEGWAFDHQALYSPYHAAGSISLMDTRKGVEYCRIHTGTAKGYKRRGKFYRSQVTYVMSRKVNPAV